MSASHECRVRIIHHNPIVAMGTAALLAAQPGIAVENFAAGASAAPAHADVVVCDYDAALELLSTQRRPDAARLLVITDIDREVQVRAALQAGVRGYLLIGSSADELESAVRAVGRGGYFTCRAVAPLVASTLVNDPLTQRESQILRLLVDGMGNKQIAARLDIAVGTVKSHVKAILQKLGAVTRTQAAAVANRRGLVAAAAGDIVRGSGNRDVGRAVALA